MFNYHMEFNYDHRGYGDLVVFSEQQQALKQISRTGSITQEGSLVNSIPAGTWGIRKTHPPVDTAEVAMVYRHGWGKKVRLFSPEGEWTHYLIHYDGGLPGTKGCIGLLDNPKPIFAMIDQILLVQSEIALFINVAPRRLQD